ncbi:MAG: 6,7-dimethyl-8-ribityllumazine synthase [Pelagibacterales bacterium]|nr:6,7-dimethyl-8-ribityllumazine synthase [Pelagibacterales bacterium]|tara:strand:+ start:3086 stop:3523 length:438 start_codon:yes stop_codon:yes gene_type:complete
MERKKNILVIVSDYYKEISSNLLKETTNELTYNNLLFTIETVTGVFEIPSIITFAKNKFDGYIALGCVIRGETSHYEYVCNESARALMNLSLEGLALGYGILTCENYEQALARSISSKNVIGKGLVATRACINQIDLKRKYTYES